MEVAEIHTPLKMRQVAKKLSGSPRFRVMVVSLLTLSVILGLVMSTIEKSAPGARIQDVGDGLWFAVTTVTGVGYGDMYPVTAVGRFLAAILEIVGVVIFGSIAAFVSVELLRYQEDFNMKRVLERLDQIEERIEEVKKRTDYLVKK